VLMEQTAAKDMAKYFTLADAARVLGQSEAKTRDWQRKGFAPTLTTGRVQLSRADVLRMFVLGQVQRLLGPVAISTEIARAMTPEALDAILDADEPFAEAEVGGPLYRVALDPREVDAMRVRMAAVPR
jgi:hypothetical protein